MKALTRLVIFAGCLPVLMASAAAQEKTRVLRREELPRRTYQLTGKALEILNDKVQLDRLSAEVAAGLRGNLEKYDIPVKPLLRNFYTTLLLLHLSRGEPDPALTLINKLNELDNIALVRLNTLFAESWVKALGEASDRSSPEFRKAFERHYAESYARLPYSEIALAVENSKTELMLANPEVSLGGAEAQLQPLLDKAGGVVDEDIVVSLIAIKFILEYRLPLREEMLRVTKALIDANARSAPKADIWAARSVALTPAEAPRPVVVAVWDAGVDMQALPSANRFVNPREIVDGKDNDGNGYVDDVHGIAYDLANSKKSVGTLDDPTGKVKSDVKRLQALVKGSLDLQSGVQSTEAAELQRLIASFTREQAKEFQEFQEEIGFYNAYSHGTHVAGIVAQGNPAAKILGARMTHDFHVQQMPYTTEKARFVAQMYRDMVAYFKKQRVRVVNMSWRYDMVSILRSLTANGIGKDAGERWEIADSMFEIEKQALYEAIKGAPEILFICASGNEALSTEFLIPAGFDLPNLITVGAVDTAGRKTSFTNTGESVDFYANGFEVDSLVPGGDRIKMSGTSMAAPQVANLAAKLLALNPRLTPTALIQLIAKGAEPSAEDPKIRLINPRKSLRLTRQ
jgi:hypothetical protein